MTIPAGYSECAVSFGGLAAPTLAYVTFGIQNTANATPATVATLVNTRFNANIVPLLSNNITHTGCRVKNGPDATGPFASVSATNVGGVATVGVTPNVAVLVVKNTALGGRQGRGRMYIPGLPEAQVDAAGVIQAGTVTTWAGALTSFLNGLNTDGIPMVLLHKNPATPPSPVTSLGIFTGVATQRRRLRR